MDLKREIRLGDLVPRRGKAGAQRGSSTVKSLVGLKVGASQIAAASVVNNGAAELIQVARAGLEPGVVVGGELRKPEALAEALDAFFATNRLPRKAVRLGIATNRIGVRAFDVTGISDPKQLANAVRFRAQEALPIPMHEAVLDYHVLNESVDDAGETVRRILLVVTYRELIDRYVSACRQADLELHGIDLEAFALLRALASPRAVDGETGAALVAVSVGHERSTFAVSDGRVCEFTRVLDWGGATLNAAIGRVLNLTPSEADPIKRSLTVGGSEVPESLTDVEAGKAREALRREIQSFARELVSSLQFYQNQPGSLGIGEIVLTGGTAHLEGFAEQLGQLIGVSVRLGDPLGRVRHGDNLAAGDQLGSYTIAIGLGIED